MRIIFVLPFFLTTLCFCQHELSIDILGVPSSEGKVSVAIYDSADAFLEMDRFFKGDSTAAQKGTTQLSFSNLPEGEYALAVFYDKNGNGELDTNWLGIPKEKVAFSKAKMKAFGPPSFEECAFTLNGNRKISVSF